MLYYPHNIDFIWLAASMDGRGTDTIRAAREFAASARPETIREMPDMETAPAAPSWPWCGSGGGRRSCGSRRRRTACRT